MKISCPYNAQALSIQGFTLIEVLVAIAVLTIGIFSLYSMQVTTVQSNTKANELTITTAVASDCYERLWNTSYDDALLNDPDAGAQLPAPDHTSNEFVGFTRPDTVSTVEWEIETWVAGDGLDNDGDGETDENDETDIKRVTLNVNYNNDNFSQAGVREPTTIIFYKSRLF